MNPSPQAQRDTDLESFMPDLNGGVFKAYIETMLSQVAAAVVQHGRAGQVQITLDMKKVDGNLDQVMVAHELKYKMPKKRGMLAESDKESTPFFVNKHGRMSLLPEHNGQMFTKLGEVNPDGNPAR